MAQLRWVFRRVITPIVGASLIWIVVLAIAQGPDIALGVDGVGDVADALAGQRIGIVTNHAAATRDGLPTAIVVPSELPDTQRTAVFTAEHGRHASGDEPAVASTAGSPRV